MILARQAIGEIRNGRAVMDALRHYPLEGGGYLGKYVLVAAYYEMVRNNEMNPDARLLESLRMKPMRTLSGVTTVTGSDQALSVSRQMYLLSDRCADAEILSRR